MKIYQMTKPIAGSIFLYPTPVIKSDKFLIYAPTSSYGEILKKCLDAGYLASPFASIHSFRQQSLHGDGETVIFELVEEQFILKFLTEEKRKTDENRAQNIEKILSAKILKLMQVSSAEDRLICKKELEHRYQTQIKCSECQKLGIADPQLKNWIDSLVL